MIVGVLEVEILLFDASSLKEKRKVLRSLKDRLKNRFNVSMAEVDGQDLWQRTTFAFAAVGNDGAHVTRMLQEVLNFLSHDPRFEITRHRMEFR